MSANIRRITVALSLLALLVLLGGVTRIAFGAAPTVPPVALPFSAGDWPMYGHDLQRTSYNAAENTISAGNVNQLTSRWQAYVGSDVYPTSSSPVIANGKVYVGSSVTTGDNYFAFNALTGAGAGLPFWAT